MLNEDKFVLLLAFLNDAKMKCFHQAGLAWREFQAAEWLRPFLGA